MAENLFTQTDTGGEPLASRMRPRTIDEFVGQEHILGDGRLLRRAITADLLSSIILYGPPGTGKTTLARVIANSTKSRFISINAVLSGVKEIRESIDQARTNLELYDTRTILFVDEVHRWNKAQQDALLPWVENGTVVLIGATTQNPFFEVNSALVSRSRVFQLKPLSAESMRLIAERALTDPIRGYGRFDVRIDPDALDHLVMVADGDARGLLGALQLAVETTPDAFPPPDATGIHITREIAEESIQQRAVLYDKEGDYHYDAISAFIKSIRGSDPDATLYWMARMIHSGEHPNFIFRRMLISASEDVGLADPNALTVVESAARAFDRVGLPEGNFHLAHAALYLATAPKSNSALGYFDALEAVAAESQKEVPNHLRDASRDTEGFGHGKGYLYPHAFRDHWVAQAYLPGALKGRIFYQPSMQGYEAGVAEATSRRRELQLEAVLADRSDEILTFSSETDRRLGEWVGRAEQRKLSATAIVRDAVSASATIARHHRVLLTGRDATLHLWEAIRSAPEGRVAVWLRDLHRVELVNHYAGQLPDLERPLLVTGEELRIPEGEPARFERIILADALSNAADRDRVPARVRQLAEPSTRLICIQRLPRHGMRISSILAAGSDGPASIGHLPPELARALDAAETRVYEDPSNDRVNWSQADVVDSVVAGGWTVERTRTIEAKETRRLGRETVERWFDRARVGGLGWVVANASDEQTRLLLERAIIERVADRNVEWVTRSIIVEAVPAGA